MLLGIVTGGNEEVEDVVETSVDVVDELLDGATNTGISMLSSGGSELSSSN